MAVLGRWHLVDMVCWSKHIAVDESATLQKRWVCLNFQGRFGASFDGGTMISICITFRKINLHGVQCQAMFFFENLIPWWSFYFYPYLGELIQFDT